MKSVGKYTLYTKIWNKFFKLRFEILSTNVSRNPLLAVKSGLNFYQQ